MIDRKALDLLYPEYEDQINEFYLLLVKYTNKQELKKIEVCLNHLNLLAKKNKTRPVYYDQHCLKHDIDTFIVETYRLIQINKKVKL